MQEFYFTGRTVEEATEAAYAEAEKQGFEPETITVTVEELPQKRLFKSTPAKVKLVVEGEEPAAPAPAAEVEAAPAEAPAQPAAVPAAPAQPVVDETPVPLEIAENEKLSAAAEYLRGVFAQMGAGEVSMSAERQGEAYILKVDGEHLGVLIGRRGETMEALSYLGSLVANRLPGDYMKLGLDVAGYRQKREQDLQALAKRMAEKVRATGRSYTMDPMNPYERRIIHSTVSAMEGVRSESKGEGSERRVVIYSTDPNARPARPLRENRNGRPGGRPPRREGRGERPERGRRPSSVPQREFADRPQDTSAPVAPPRTERINDAEDFDLFGKIEL